MYVEVPTNVSAMELMSSPETPKSHILISPLELQRMLEGLISTGKTQTMWFIGRNVKNQDILTSMDDSVNIVQIR